MLTRELQTCCCIGGAHRNKIVYDAQSAAAKVVVSLIVWQELWRAIQLAAKF